MAKEKAANKPKLPQQYFGERLLRIGTVQQITGKSRTAIYTEPDFPKPRRIGERAVAWVESEIRAWVAARVSEAEAA